MSAPPSAAGAARAYDVFNGDADGICALHQLRLARPKPAQLVTGVKRDVELLRRLPEHAALDVTVLDVSLDCNLAPLRRILDDGGHVAYFDHHTARQAFAHPDLEWHWDDSPQVCTSILVDRHLGGRFRAWAAVAAFGDNLAGAGRALAAAAGVGAFDTARLEQLGLALNYNAYGERVEDLHVAPDRLYLALHGCENPLEFIEQSPHYRALRAGYGADLAQMDGLRAHWRAACGAVYVLPDQPWARRISGVFANSLAAAQPEQSFAVLSENADGSYLVSVRSGAPGLLAACALCERFAGGGGRRAAAGINRLPAAELEHFIACFADYFGAGANPDAGGGAPARQG
jgi:hypothetical protein